MSTVEHEPASAVETEAAPDLAAAGAAAGLVVLAWAVGSWLTAHGADVHAPVPPLYAGFGARVGPGTAPALLLAALAVLRGPELAARLPWRWLLVVGYSSSVAWTIALALIDGWRIGVAGRLTVPTEYLREVPSVHDVGAFLRTFTTHILAFQPGSFTTHVAAHPPLAVLVFVALDRLGLGGGAPAGVLCILVGASAPVASAIATRALGGPGGERVARAALPFTVFAPTAIWVGVSADGMYAGVLALAVALLAVAATRVGAGAVPGGPSRLCWMVPALVSGVLFGCCLFFSYGLALAGLFPLAVLLVTRRVAPIAVAAVGVAGVVTAFTSAGFWWWTGYQLTRVLYAQPHQLGSADRAYGYWVWAAPAAFAVALGPATVAGVRRVFAGRRWPAAPPGLAVLCGAALLAVLVADLSGLSRGEAERIWLPFAMWLMPAAGLLPPRHRRWWLLAQVTVALAVNHLLTPPW